MTRAFLDILILRTVLLVNVILRCCQPAVALCSLVLELSIIDCLSRLKGTMVCLDASVSAQNVTPMILVMNFICYLFARFSNNSVHSIYPVAIGKDLVH